MLGRRDFFPDYSIYFEIMRRTGMISVGIIPVYI